MRPSNAAWLFLLALAHVSCAKGGDTDLREAQERAPIVGNEAHVDDAHPSVVAIVGGGDGHLCSGTIIGRAAAGNGLYVLTAAHCCGKSLPPRQVRLGADFTDPTRTLPVTAFRQHPCYNPLSHDYDLCVVQVDDSGTLNVKPVPLASAPDALQAGSTVTFVGYGSSPASNVTRRRVEAQLAEVTPLTLTADQTQGRGGVCFGDSGGPALITQRGVEVVAGVASFAASTSLCNVLGVAGRVTNPGVREAFIDKVLAGEEPTIAGLLILRTGTSAGQVRDTYIASDQPDQRFGDGVELLVGTPPRTTATRRVLLRFDLTGVPLGMSILSAHMGLHEESKTGPGTILVHRVTKDWDEDRETWSSFGPDGFDPTVVARFDNATAIVSITDEVSFDVTGLVQDWLAGRAENDGIMLRDTGPEQTQLLSSEIGRITERPWLHVCYLPPAR